MRRLVIVHDESRRPDTRRQFIRSNMKICCLLLFIVVGATFVIYSGTLSWSGQVAMSHAASPGQSLVAEDLASSCHIDVTASSHSSTTFALAPSHSSFIAAPVAWVTWLFDTTGFPRRWNCGNWSSALGWLHIISDTSIWGAYMAIPMVLGYFIIKKRSPIPYIAWLFVAFIACCGIEHLIEACIFWSPVYRLAGVWKLVTAVVSWATVCALVPIVPRVLKWPTLEQVNEQLRHEIAQREQAETELRRANTRLDDVNYDLALRDAALNAHAIVAITDKRGRIEYVNDRFCEISGYSRAELIGQDHRIVNSGFHPRTFFKKMYHTISSGSIWRGEICNRAKNGGLYWVKTSIIPEMDESGRVRRYIAIRDDITYLKRIEQELEMAVFQLRTQGEELERRCAELERFSFVASHDLKAPLVTITGYANCITHCVKEGQLDDLADFACRVAQSADRMRDKIDAMLELSRLGRAEPVREAVHLEVITHEIEEQFRPQFEAKGIAFSTSFAVPVVHADRSHISQIIQNLVANAIHHGSTGTHPLIRVGSSTENGEVNIYVSDNGPGVPPEYGEYIFGLFQHLAHDNKSTGVGLAIVRQIAENYGGRAWLESTDGPGATFKVSLPAGVSIGSSSPALCAFAECDSNDPRLITRGPIPACRG